MSVMRLTQFLPSYIPSTLQTELCRGRELGEVFKSFVHFDAITRYDVFDVFTNIMTHFEALCSGMDVFQI